MKITTSIKKLFILFFVLFAGYAVAQKQSDLDRLYWSAKERISIEDFGIKSKDTSAGLSSAAFSLEYDIHGLSFFIKNFNKRVRHCMIRSASQIALDGNEERYIRCQQTLFDIEEIYVRRFRKALRENRGKLFLKTTIAEELKDQIIGIDLPNRQAQYNNETNIGKNLTRQREWERKIQEELNELKDFEYEK